MSQKTNDSVNPKTLAETKPEEEKVLTTASSAPADAGEEVVSIADSVRVLSPAQLVAKRFFRSKLSVIGLAVIIFLFALSFIGPLFSPWSKGDGKDYSHPSVVFTPNDISYIGPDGQEYEAFGVILDEGLLSYSTHDKPSTSHWLGTDNEGYDVLTRLMEGGRISLTIGFVVIILETLLGVLLGGIAGYFGGWVDMLIMRIVDILSCIPTLPILLILSAIFNDITSIAKLYYMMMFITLIGWSGSARLVRGQILSLREQEYMLAAKCSGLSTGKKIFKHLLPNIIPQLVVSMTMGLGSIILMEATLGYLGLGAPLGTATWGNIIQLAAQSEFRNSYPNMWLGAGICITLAILAFNFVGDGLRDAFDPKMKR